MNFPYFYVLISLIVSLFFASEIKAEKYALIIAIGDYPDAGGWSDISSANDVPHVKNALLCLGFENENIVVVRDAAATKEQILFQFSQLKNRVSQGDIIYIHYSGHGQQVVDDNNDELDLLDEAIVPFDSPLKYESGINEGQFLIRDDELGALTYELRQVIGQEGQLILVLDSCHSGTGTRGLGKVRGTDKLMAPKDFVSIGSTEKSMQISMESAQNLASIASFFGSSAKELNYETIDEQKNTVGSLSYAISSVLANMNEAFTFEELFDLVKLKMKKIAPMQHPQWEGPKNTLVFGQKAFENNEFFAIANIIDEMNVEMSGGTLSGVYVGSKIDVFNKKDNTILVSGEVISARLTNAMVQLENEVIFSENTPYGIKISSYAYPNLKINLAVSLSEIEKWNPLYEQIISIPNIEICEENADFYMLDADDNAVILSTKNGQILSKMYNEDLGSNEKLLSFKKSLLSYMQANFLRSYNNFNPRINCDIEILNIDPDSEEVVSTFDPLKDVMKPGDCIKFKISNNGINGAYVSLLDIQPDNYINLIIPPTELGYTAEEYYVKPGESITSHFIIEIAEPFGEETLLLLASREPQDLSGIISTGGQTKRGFSELDSFQQLLLSSYGNVQQRGTKIRQSKREIISTKTLFFDIVNKSN